MYNKEPKTEIALQRDIIDQKRIALAKKCVDNPYDDISFLSLCKLIHPIAAYHMKGVLRVVPYLGQEDCFQIADIVLWKVINRIREKPDILQNFAAYLFVSIRNAYISEFRKFVWKNMASHGSYNALNGTSQISIMYDYAEYVRRITEQINAQRRKRRAENPEHIRMLERNYWHKHKDLKAAKDKRYYDSHRLEIAAYAKQYRETHKEEKRERERRWRANNPELSRERRRNYYHKTIDAQREYRKQWDAANADKKREYQRRYFEKHREEILARKREYKRIKRMENRNQSTQSATDEEP